MKANNQQPAETTQGEGQPRDALERRIRTLEGNLKDINALYMKALDKLNAQEDTRRLALEEFYHAMTKCARERGAENVYSFMLEYCGALAARAADASKERGT